MATYSGLMYSAQEALDIGLVNKVVELPQLLETAKQTATAIASRAPGAVAAIKRSINGGYNTTMNVAEETEARLFAGLFHTQDQKEGTRAFIEKRKPDFKGN